MAERYPTPPTQLETVMNEINETFDNLILQLNNRRQALLDEVRALSEEITARRRAKKSKLTELNNMKLNIQRDLRHNELIETQNRFIADINQQLRDLDISSEEISMTFEYANEKLKTEIHSFGSIIKRKGITPNYSNMKQPIIAVGKQGNHPGEINFPSGVAFCEETKQIFIADRAGLRKDMYIGYIHIFAENGMFMKRIEGTIKFPWGVAIYKNSLYVTDCLMHAIILYKLPECTLVKSVTNLGFLKGKFHSPRGLTASNNGDLFIADNYNNRIVEMDCNLTYKHQLTHTTITKPMEVKIHDNTLFILCYTTDSAIQVFSMKGNYLYSMIAKQQVGLCLYFCIDMIGNIIMSDKKEHNIKVFNKKGELTNIIGKEGHNKGELYNSRGIAITNLGKIITISWNINFNLQIFK